eukprot:SAG31_NODE_3275_length_4474_cov_17.108114_3_plen_95_part_00
MVAAPTVYVCTLSSHLILSALQLLRGVRGPLSQADVVGHADGHRAVRVLCICDVGRDSHSKTFFTPQAGNRPPELLLSLVFCVLLDPAHQDLAV